MSTYSRNTGRVTPSQQNPQPHHTQPHGSNGPNNGHGEDAIRVNGFAQVLEMLKAADPAFRESILRRLAARDMELVRSLRADLANAGL